MCAGAACAQGAVTAPSGGASAANPSAADYADALMTLDCPTCEGKVESLRGFSLATPGQARPISRTAPAPAPVARTTRAPGPHVASLKAPAVSAGDLQLTFRRGSADLTPAGEANARSFAAALNDPRLASASFQIVGHTDATGSAELNLRLSQARAESVKSFLVQRGVDASRLEAKGVGSQDLATPNDPAAAANRRVEVKRVG
jgi:outer membrane protein OmpA-like peptidoglycan-associated protein